MYNMNLLTLRAICMHKRDLVSCLENTIYDDIEELNYKQIIFIEEINQELLDSLTDNIDLSEEQLHDAVSFIKVEIIYYTEPYSTEKKRAFKNQLISILSEPPRLNINIPSNSFLAVLYYINDIIAGSTAMGRGIEDSIIPNTTHSSVLIQFLQKLYEHEKALSFLENCKKYKKNESYKRIAHLLINITETSYARLQGWRISKLAHKQATVDDFYQTAAEFCMAKGSLYLLKELQNLPPQFALELSQITFNRDIIELLKTCSQESYIEIQTTNQSRRYRSGNSGSVWIDLRNKQQFN